MKKALQKFFSVQHQFRIDPSSLNLSDHVLLWVGIVLVVVGLAVRLGILFVEDRLYKNLLFRFYHLMLTIGLLELLWYGLRFENVAFFGSHFVAYVVLLIGLVWLAFIIKYWWRVYPAEREKLRKEQVKLKYL